MKNIFKFLLLVTLSIILFSCKKDETSCYECTKDNKVTKKCFSNGYTEIQIRKEIRNYEKSYGYKCSKIR
jgi:hypothetical protein